MNEVTKKWFDYGFLYGITDTRSMDVLAFKYEEVSKLIKQDNQPLMRLHQDRLETVIFPVIRRIYSQYNSVNTNHLYQHFKNWIMDNHERIEEASKKAINNIDAEAEEMTNYSEYYIERFKTVIKPNQYLEKHKL